MTYGTFATGHWLMPTRSLTSELGSSEELLRVLTSHTPVGVFVSNAEGACEYVNQRWCELAGLTAEQAVGDGWAAAIHPDDASRVRAEWAAASAAGTDSVVEYRFRRPDGEVSWIQGYAAAVRNADGEVIGWVGTCLDLTAQQLAGEELKHASERFRTAFDNAPIGMALVGPDGRWLQVNPALCELLGYAEEELLELTFLDVTHPDDQPSSIERKWRQLHGGETRGIEKRYVDAAGNVVWVSVTSTMVRDDSGNGLYSVAQIQDIDDRKHSEDELRRLADEDSLTGLLNRRRFQEEVDRELLRMQREGSTAALLLLDLDQFKHINDSLGHKAGDDLLIAVANTIRSRVRRTDFVGRLGGDEFGVLAIGTDGDNAYLLADSIVQALRTQPFVTAGTSVRVTVSIGVVTLDADSANSVAAFVAADDAMYRAKHDGRDGVVLVA